MVAFIVGFGLSATDWQTSEAVIVARTAQPSDATNITTKDQVTVGSQPPPLDLSGAPYDPLRPSLERRLRDLLTRWSLDGVGEALAKWTLQDLRAAAALLVEKRHSRSMRDVLHASHLLVAAWAEKEPAAALAWVKAFPELSPRLRNSWTGDVYGVMARSDPEGVFKLIATEPSAFRRGEITGTCLSTWARSSPEAAIQWFAQNPELLTHAWNFGTDNSRQFKARWAAMERLPPGPAVTALRAALLEYLTVETVEDYRFIMDQADNGHLVSLRNLNPASSEAKRQLWEMVSAADPLSAEHELMLTRLGATEFVGNKGFSAALSLLAKPLTESQRSALVGRIGATLNLGKDGRERAQQLDQLRDPVLRSEVLVQALNHSADKSGNFQKAIEFLNAQDQPALRTAGAMKIAYRWSEDSSKDALQWVQRLPAGAEREWAMAGFVANMATTDIGKAQDLMRLIQSKEARLAAQKTIATRWLQKNAATARPWVDAQRFSTNDLADIRDAAAFGSEHGAFRPDGRWTTKP